MGREKVTEYKLIGNNSSGPVCLMLRYQLRKYRKENRLSAVFDSRLMIRWTYTGNFVCYENLLFSAMPMQSPSSWWFSVKELCKI